MVLDELVGIVRWDTDPKGLKQTRRGVLSMKREVTGAVSILGSLRRGLIEAFAARAIFRGAQRLIGGIVQTNSRFEQLQARLHTVTGSSEKAAKAFDLILRFAKDTPFTVDNLTDAFITLRGAGIVPTEEMLTSFANTAAANGKSMSEFAVAIRGAITGEMEAMKAFNIVTRVEGEKLAVTFQGQTRRINRNAGDLVGLLQEIGETTFAGGAARQMNTLVGVMSNVQDAADQLAMKVGEQGLNAKLKQMGREILETLDNSDELAEGLGEGLSAVAEVLLEQLQSFLEWIENLKGEDVKGFISDVVGVMRLLMSVGGRVLGFLRDLVTGVGGATGALKILGGAFVGLKLAEMAGEMIRLTGTVKALGIAAQVAGGPWLKIAGVLAGILVTLYDLIPSMDAFTRKAQQIPRTTGDLYQDLLRPPRDPTKPFSAEDIKDPAARKYALKQQSYLKDAHERVERATGEAAKAVAEQSLRSAKDDLETALGRGKKADVAYAFGEETVKQSQALLEKEKQIEKGLRTTKGKTREKYEAWQDEAERRRAELIRRGTAAKGIKAAQLDPIGYAERALWTKVADAVPDMSEEQQRKARDVLRLNIASSGDIDDAVMQAINAIATQGLKKKPKKKRGGKKKKPVDKGTAWEQKVAAARERVLEEREFSVESELLRTEPYLRHDPGYRRDVVRAKMTSETRRLDAMIAAGDYSALGGEFSQSSRLMREAGLIEQAARAAPPVIAMSVVRIGDIHIGGVSFTVDKANATAQDIAGAFRREFDAAFKQKVKEAILPHMPAVVR